MDITDIISNFPHRLGEAILNIWGSRNSRRTDTLDPRGPSLTPSLPKAGI